MLPFGPSAGQNASNTGWGGYPVDFYRCCHLTKYVRVFRPGRPLMPTPIFQAGFQDVSDNHPDLGYHGFPATNNFLKDLYIGR